MPSLSPSFLVIRRDNIGDLVCTTPLFRALREAYPNARICALVNSYNRAVLENNADIDQVYWYSKTKHQVGGLRKLAAVIQKVRLIISLRREHYDYAILGSPGAGTLRLAKMIAPVHVVGFTNSQDNQSPQVDIGIPYGPLRLIHEVEDTFRLLGPLGIGGKPGPVRVFPDPAEAHKARLSVTSLMNVGKHQIVGVHISARKPSQRWPAGSYVKLIRELVKIRPVSVMLFWSPGDEADLSHPGDDRKAAEILSALADEPVVGYPTHRLQELVGGLSVCAAVICSDGGAMHLAAGLGKPILCFFGKSNSSRWRPWGVPHVLLQPPSQEVTDITTSDALAGFLELLNETRLSHCA